MCNLCTIHETFCLLQLKSSIWITKRFTSGKRDFCGAHVGWTVFQRPAHSLQRAYVCRAKTGGHTDRQQGDLISLRLFIIFFQNRQKYANYDLVRCDAVKIFQRNMTWDAGDVGTAFGYGAFWNASFRNISKCSRSDVWDGTVQSGRWLPLLRINILKMEAVNADVQEGTSVSGVTLMSHRLSVKTAAVCYFSTGNSSLPNNSSLWVT
jgi:hypothetical protein